MADLFTNTTLYASAVNGLRTPVSRNFEDPDVPDTGGGGAENPDPGGPGGGTPTGGDIGNVDGSGTSTLGPAPGVTRKTHSADIFVAAGGVMAVTYVADGTCTLVPKRPRADMTLSRTDDGRELTITWNVPAGEPGDSTYIGVEAWVYGDDTSENVTSLWDRLHIGKVAGDVKTIGVGTSYPVLQNGIERPDVDAGDTIIIKDGTYTDFYDVVNVGYWGGPSGGVTNFTTPNGVSTGVTTVNVIGSDGVTVTGTEDIKSVDKFTTIMAETPLGVVLDRQHNRRSCSLYGNYRGRDGNREVYGVKIKGIAQRHGPSTFVISGADECAFEFCSIVMDTNPEDYIAATGRTWTFGDGALWDSYANRNCYFENCISIGNHRYGLIIRSTPESNERASKHCSFRKMIHTSACSYSNEERIHGGFNFYGARTSERLNLLCVDSAFYEAGHRDRYTFIPTTLSYGQGIAPAEHASFLTVNESGDDFYDEGLISLNTTTSGYRLENDNQNIRSSLKNSVFWDKKGSTGSGAMVYISRMDVDNLTVGKSSNSINESCVRDIGFNASTRASFSKLLMIHGAWDYGYASGDKTISGQGDSSDGDMCIIPTSATNSTYTGDIAGETTLIGSSNAKSSGAHYISRTEEGSTLRGLDLGCSNVFPQIGVGGQRFLDGDRDRYDGTGGNQYINWLSEAPHLEMRKERQEYSCLANGLQFSGALGMGKAGVNPTDYINRFGTTPSHPLNAPYIDNFYVKALGGGGAIAWWRPVCPAYRSTITGYHLYIDGVEITTNGPLKKDQTTYTYNTINPGTRAFNIVVIDPTYGNSGFSTTVLVTVT